MNNIDAKQENEKFIIVCAWCELILSQKAIPGARRTHTICETCLERVRRDINSLHNERK
jgi:hypothetical protein